jgi:dephospho-CoA kinase
MIGHIFAVAGLCGVGKTTAVNFLAEVSGGEVVYFGNTVLRVVRERGLPETSESEQIVRIDLRKRNGRSYLAILEAERIRAIVSAGRSAFVDAVYTAEEFDYLANLAPGAKFILIGIEVSFTVRLERLQKRPARPLTENQMRARDALEMTTLNTGDILSRAAFRLNNEATMDDFVGVLRDVLEKSRV